MGSPTGTARSRRSQASRACGGSAPAASSPIPGCRCCTTFRGSRSGTACGGNRRPGQRKRGRTPSDRWSIHRSRLRRSRGPRGRGRPGSVLARQRPHIRRLRGPSRVAESPLLRCRRTPERRPGDAHIAATTVRNLRAQESVATDEGSRRWAVRPRSRVSGVAFARTSATAPSARSRRCRR